MSKKKEKTEGRGGEIPREENAGCSLSNTTSTHDDLD